MCFDHGGCLLTYSFSACSWTGFVLTLKLEINEVDVRRRLSSISASRKAKKSSAEKCHQEWLAAVVGSVFACSLGSWSSEWMVKFAVLRLSYDDAALSFLTNFFADEHQHQSWKDLTSDIPCFNYIDETELESSLRPDILIYKEVIWLVELRAYNLLKLIAGKLYKS